MVKKRVGLSQKIRFQIFERDSFMCSYCGNTPPNVVLQVDHIIPVSKGGNNIPENLTTSCFDCNIGKKDKLLGESSKKISKNLEDIKEKKIQLEALYKYQKKVEKILQEKIDRISDLWEESWNYKYSLNNRGKLTIRSFLRILPYEEVEEAVIISTSKITNNVESCYKYLCGVLHNKRRSFYGEK